MYAKIKMNTYLNLNLPNHPLAYGFNISNKLK